MRPGELVRAVIVAPKLKLARSPFQHLVGTMQASPRLAKLFAEEPNKESCVIRRPDGRTVLIELVAADVGGAGLRVCVHTAGAKRQHEDACGRTPRCLHVQVRSPVIWQAAPTNHAGARSLAGFHAIATPP